MKIQIPHCLGLTPLFGLDPNLIEKLEMKKALREQGFSSGAGGIRTPGTG